MSTNWESTFHQWAQAPAADEQRRCDNAIRAISNAIKASEKLAQRNIIVFAQGSYRNRTNVRKDSDVDTGILCDDSFFSFYPKGYTRESFGNKPATYYYTQFKNEVGDALSVYFGKDSVSRGNKAFNIRENSYHVDADAAPFFEHHRYSDDGQYLSGVELRADNGTRIINWPEQHYQNGVNKNKFTHKRFKSLVRILKSLRNRMDDEGIVTARPISGFLVECLVWNVPNDYFGNFMYTADVYKCLAFLFNNTLSDEKCSEWGEVSELIYLFRGFKKCTRQQAHNFLSDAWDYLGFEG